MFEEQGIGLLVRLKEELRGDRFEEWSSEELLI